MIKALVREYKLDNWIVQRYDDGTFAIGGPYAPKQILIGYGTPKRGYVISDYLKNVFEIIYQDYQSGKLQSILQEKDFFEMPITVYTINHKEVIKTICEKFGYPNTDIKGRLQYENTYFLTRKEAYAYLLQNTRFKYLRWIASNIRQHVSDVKKGIGRLLKQLYYAIYARSIARIFIKDDTKS